MNNKNKKNLLVGSAICMIVLGALIFIDVMVSFAALDSGWDDFFLVVMFDLIMLAGSFALVILGSLLCNKKFRAKKSMVTGATILAGSLLLAAVIYAFIGEYLYTVYFEIALAIAVLIMLIIGSVMPDMVAADNSNQYQQPTYAPYQDNNANQYRQSNAPHQGFNANEKQQKLDYLKGLRDSGQITEDEYKTLKMKELEK